MTSPLQGWSAKFTGALLLWTSLLGAIFVYAAQNVMSQLRQTQQLVSELQERVEGRPSGTELVVARANLQTKSSGTKSFSSLLGAGDHEELSLTSEVVDLLEKDGPSRRLGATVWGNVAAKGAALDDHTGCIYVTGAATIALNSLSSCGSGSGQKCPLCFICNSAGTFDLRLDDCSSAYYSSSNKITDGTAKMMIEITVVNVGSAACSVKTTGGAAVTSGSVTSGKVDTFICFSTALNDAITGLTTDFLYINDGGSSR